MQLSEAQIAHLFIFTEKKFVRWYDLQVELVDHLANKIEELMIANPKISFERALGNVYESFGLFGFAHIVQQKEAEMQKLNNKVWWRQFKLQFCWPNIMRTVSVFLGFYYLNKIDLLKDIVMAILIVFNLIFMVYCYRVFIPKRKQKKLLMMQFLPFNGLITVVYVQIYFDCFFRVIFGTEYVSDTNMMIANCISFVGTLLLLNGNQIYKDVYRKARMQYPKAFEY